MIVVNKEHFSFTSHIKVYRKRNEKAKKAVDIYIVSFA